MNKLTFAAAVGAACLALAACNKTDTDQAGNAAAADEADGAATANGSAGAAADATAFPKGARIVEEKGVTWRIDADGTRVRLGDADSRIVVENGVRYRVDPGGNRVKIDKDGLDIDIDTPDVDLPDVDVGINDKGNPDIDVKDKSDGDDGPN